jgi:Rieske Fe-S protein
MKPLQRGQSIPLTELADRLREPTRRDFCKGALAGAALLGVPACSSSGGYPRVGTGGIDPGGTDPGGGVLDLALPGGGGHPLDLAGPLPPSADLAQPNPPPPDLTMLPPPPDLTMPVGNCPVGISDTGTAPAQVAQSTAVYTGDTLGIFLCRDGGGLYALSAVCTHQGCAVSFRGSEFRCPCHGAIFSFNGDALSGPNNGPLVHFPLCLTGGGTLGVDPNNNVDPAQRYNY